MIPSLFNGTVSASACSAATFSSFSIPDASIISVEAQLALNVTQNISIGAYSNNPGVNVVGANFCNVTTTYTHTGDDDSVQVQVWLPLDTWNGRLQFIGGAGWQAGLHPAGLMAMTAAIGQGFVAVSTDAGLGSDFTPENWALREEGVVNMRLLKNFGSDSLIEATDMAKAYTNAFYGEPAHFSYWNGCSQGGRQGLMMAQKYPDAFDGIAAAAPAINWISWAQQMEYSAFLMDQLNEFPPTCEFDALTAAAIETCDSADGLADGIITDATCKFDPMSMVGTAINCTGVEREVSQAAAIVMGGVWGGAKRGDNSSMGFGPSMDAILTGTITDLANINTTCSKDSTCGAETCTRGPVPLADDWFRLFLLKNSTASVSGFTQAEYDNFEIQARAEYEDIIDTSNPDLSGFRAAGGKMITYHGMADSVIPAKGTENYYQRVTALDPSVREYYRLFMAPGLHHCFGGPGMFPNSTFATLMRWVEEGEAPDVLLATSVLGLGATTIEERPLCPYPQVQKASVGADGQAVFTCE
ncbi:tannase [Plectosphaerella plurivora]|uniref:Carboxylic ester hydrolase n=1 Tax=Plectosphaerella plurivora TaxID=936078 RepID=A0A9P9AGI2_9PEZI|nr:tannase [Plectosphaerella plurivora]